MKDGRKNEIKNKKTPKKCSASLNFIIACKKCTKKEKRIPN